LALALADRLQAATGQVELNDGVEGTAASSEGEQETGT
jgi:hypothetical protein